MLFKRESETFLIRILGHQWWFFSIFYPESDILKSPFCHVSNRDASLYCTFAVDQKSICTSCKIAISHNATGVRPNKWVYCISRGWKPYILIMSGHWFVQLLQLIIKNRLLIICVHPYKKVPYCRSQKGRYRSKWGKKSKMSINFIIKLALFDGNV